MLPLLATYLTIEGIANRLGVRRSTVKTHVVSIYRKLGASNRTDAIERAEALGLLHRAARAMAQPENPGHQPIRAMRTHGGAR